MDSRNTKPRNSAGLRVMRIFSWRGRFAPAAHVILQSCAFDVNCQVQPFQPEVRIRRRAEVARARPPVQDAWLGALCIANACGESLVAICPLWVPQF